MGSGAFLQRGLGLLNQRIECAAFQLVGFGQHDLIRYGGASKSSIMARSFFFSPCGINQHENAPQIGTPPQISIEQLFHAAILALLSRA